MGNEIEELKKQVEDLKFRVELLQKINDFQEEALVILDSYIDITYEHCEEICGLKLQTSSNALIFHDYERKHKMEIELDKDSAETIGKVFASIN